MGSFDGAGDGAILRMQTGGRGENLILVKGLRSPHTKPLPLVADRDLTEPLPEALPAAKRVRHAPRK